MTLQDVVNKFFSLVNITPIFDSSAKDRSEHMKRTQNLRDPCFDLVSGNILLHITAQQKMPLNESTNYF